MGCSSSHVKSPTRGNSNKENSSGVRSSDNNHIRVDSNQKSDEQITGVIRKELNENPQIFVLNNIFLSIQFFKNYPKEILKLQHTTASKMEKELNKQLLKDETMECTNPDIIFDKVKENVRYRPLHGPKKYTSEPMVAKRIFVISDSIEVVSSMEIPEYTSIDKPSYQVRIEESTRKGFVRLRQLEMTAIPKHHQSFKFATDPIPGPSSIPDSETYAYTTITELKTPKPLDIISNPERRDTLPKTCFAVRKIKKAASDVDSDGEYDDSDMTEEDFLESITYISSKGFMNYFQNALFPNSLGRALGFDENEISLAKAIPGKIFCNASDEEDNPIPCEVIPSVAMEWPAEQTFEFIMREERPTITDRRTGYRYRWPTDDMIKEIKSMSAVLVPKGYVQKKGVHSDADIEWEINFPKAERYLASRMSHAQMRCFLFLLAVHKTYIEPVTFQHGLLPEHIRTHMYWECELNYLDWPEHRLGTKLVKVVKNLTDRLARSALPDYFIKQKNVFENIPKKYLRFAQKVFHDVLESPVMYFLKALRNLRYTSSKFYPPLDFKELNEILTKNGIGIISPSILSAPPNLKRKKYNDAETQWRHIQELKRKEEILKKKMKKKENLIFNEEERRLSVDSINLEWSCEKKFDIYKSKATLQLFINNFIAIAKHSMKISSKEHTLFYLKQAYYLTKILDGISPAFWDEVREFEERIQKEEETCKKNAVLQDNDVPPTTPIRNSMSFDFSQQLKNNVVNFNNLQNSYNSGFQLQPFHKISKNENRIRTNSASSPTRKLVAFSEHK